MAFLKQWQEVQKWALDILFPKFCFGCGREGSFLCDSCRITMVPGVPACPVCSRRNFDGILCAACQETACLRRFFAPFSYKSRLVRELVYALKYRGVRELAPILGASAASLLRTYHVALPLDAVLIPIPLHSKRERKRGFNQSRLIAEELGRAFGRPVSEVLARKRNTLQQVSLESFQERWKNMEGAFRIRAFSNVADVKDRAAILVDDVSTSGATLAEAAQVLRGAGARTVWAIVIAKG